MEEKKKTTFPKDFFTQPRPHAKKEISNDDIPFKWSKNVINGKSKVKIVSIQKNTLG